MKYIKGHLKKNLERWTNKKWYHQRFDGAPYFLHMIAEAEISVHEKRKLGGDFLVHYCFFDDGKADWYILMDDIKKVSEAVINVSKNNPHISADFMKLWKKDEDLFYDKCFEIEKLDLKELSNDDLMSLHDEFSELALNRNSSSSLIDGFALGTDELIADEIKEVFEQSTSTLRFTEAFSILTAPVHLSFVNDAEVSLLKTALEIGNTDNLKNKRDLVEKHQKNFFWIRNNYVSDYVLGVDYFEEELKKIFSLNLNVEEEIKKIKETPEVNKKRKEELIKELNLSERLRTLIRISEDFTHWQDERKKSTFFATHYFSLLLEEISKRISIDLEDLKYMTCREVSTLFSEKPDSSELKKRKMNGVYYWDKEGFEALHSKEADEIKETLLGSTDLSDVDDFRGLTASLGQASGKVKVVKSATEIDKVEKGDILVAVMTRPDYVPAMKKAAAIVTDEGGVTCHAAIVSRELGVPCIIGTKIATKVLKDNQLVEVNANHGWVRILER